ncbi:glutaredoxin domain-containing protein [Dactylosporangium sp. NPDC050688]|uniref:glutaredoxin domain-containing protein n=1 Tax=Dactylosporangium sp. NPDC050688 TaxID=3157217 RepID=UPI0033C8F6F1
MWMVPLAFVACGTAIAANQVADGSMGAAVLFGLVFLGLAVVFSPLSFPRHTPAAVAQASGRPVVYWRPGCQYCLRLRLSLLGRARHASWVNIWRDPDGAAAVRAVADGNETVPTVVLDGTAHVNPSPAMVRPHLRPGPARPPVPRDVA